MASALTTLLGWPSVALAPEPSPVQPMARLTLALGPDCPTLLVKRDDLLSFGGGGNKVRKLQALAAEALANGADTLITCGSLQSNHARVTAATGAALGCRVILVLNGVADQPPSGNLRLDHLFGAEVRVVPTREAREPEMNQAAAEVRAGGGTPFVIPMGGSVPTGVLGFARGVLELSSARIRPDLIVHASSSGGTQAGLIAGCALVGLPARVLGVSADEPAAALTLTVRALLNGVADRLGARPVTIGADRDIEVDDRWVGEGYGIPTPASREARTLIARREGIVLDSVYTAKAMAGLLALVRSGSVSKGQTVLFWHTGGQGLGY